jgi:hypothetical protein
MLQTAKAVCPRVSEQKQGADIYQIVYTIVKTLKQYDLSATNPQFCQDSQCVVKSLITRHPVIMFKSGHAVVIVGVDFRMDVAGDNTGTFPVVEFLYVLDPAGTGVVEKWSTVSFCQADGFLAY